jgi:mono/diheme cytochrome c family protein
VTARRLLAFLAAGILLPAASAALAGGDGVTTEAGVYTKGQARSGKALYEQHCQMCHDNKYFRPVLKRWHGQTAAVLFDVMTSSMPENNPGGLMDDEYLDIMAYIFSRSRYPDAEMALTRARLPSITIEDP